MLNLKVGDKVVMLGFSGLRIGEYEITLATDTYYQIVTDKKAILTFNREGKQINVEANKKRYPNRIVLPEDAKERIIEVNFGEDRVANPVKDRIDKAVKAVTEEKYAEKPKHQEYDAIKSCINLDIPVYLVGEAGTGKNHTLQEIAEDLGLEFYFTNSVQQEYKITGFIDAGGKYHETEFYKAFTNGGLFFLDEIDASIPEVLVLLNAAIANRYFEFPCGRVNASPSFRVVAAGNTIGNGANELYTGRLVLDSATLDRFAVIEFDYDRNIEVSLAKGNTELVNFIRSLRKYCKDNGIRGTFSYRMIIAVTKLEEAKMPLEKILKIAVLKGLDRDTIRTLRVDDNSNYRRALKEVQGA
jgi:hypothetical protein